MNRSLFKLRFVWLAAALALVSIACPVRGAALDGGQYSVNIRLTRGDDDSLHLIAKERMLTLTTGSFKLNGKEYKVQQSQNINIPECPALRTSNESFVLRSPGENKPYYERVPLKCLAGGKGRGPVPGLLVDGSVQIKRADGSNQLLQPGVDYVIDKVLGCIDRVDTSKIPEGTPVKLSYSVCLRRIDTLLLDEEGHAHLMSGSYSQFAPVALTVPPNLVALANVYAPRLSQPIEASDIMPIWDRDLEDPVINELNENVLDGFKAKLKAGKSVTVAFLGDSVTDGCYATEPSRMFPQQFITRLQAKYPKCQIKAKKLALGGSTSSLMFGRFYKELLPSKPDLVIVEFVNDLSLSQK